MRRRTSIPYGEVTLLSLHNMATGTKFQLISRIKAIKQNIISLTDNSEDLDVIVEDEELSDFNMGQLVIIFGEKTEDGFKTIKIIKSNLDWDLYCRTRELESR
ncbi:MAG: hypothetical protein ACFFAU_02560 [Candidatus Hodarchaeota archaeon]